MNDTYSRALWWVCGLPVLLAVALVGLIVLLLVWVWLRIARRNRLTPTPGFTEHTFEVSSGSSMADAVRCSYCHEPLTTHRWRTLVGRVPIQPPAGARDLGLWADVHLMSYLTCCEMCGLGRDKGPLHLFLGHSSGGGRLPAEEARAEYDCAVASFLEQHPEFRGVYARAVAEHTLRPD
jgi:hypothetical protein